MENSRRNAATSQHVALRIDPETEFLLSCIGEVLRAKPSPSLVARAVLAVESLLVRTSEEGVSTIRDGKVRTLVVRTGRVQSANMANWAWDELPMRWTDRPDTAADQLGEQALNYLDMLELSHEPQGAAVLLQDAIGTSDVESRLVGLATSAVGLSDAMMAALYHRLAQTPNGLAMLLGCLPDEVEALSEGILTWTGLIQLGTSEEELFGTPLARVRPSVFLMDCLRLAPTSADTLRDLLTGAQVEDVTTLGWNDFSHLGRLRELAAQALRHQEGRHILLSGLTGTGKTEFAMLLAREAKLRMRGVVSRPAGREGNDGQLSSLAVGTAVLPVDTVVLMDNASDILQATSPAENERLHTILDRSVVPVIWTTDTLTGLAPATLRRMSVVIPFDMPSRGVREVMWRKVLNEAGAAERLARLDVPALASRWAVVPAVCTSVIRSAIDESDVHLLLESLSRINPSMVEINRVIETPFDPLLSRADLDLKDLADRLVEAGPSNWRILLAGPAGTGKSSFVHHVAQRMGMETLVCGPGDMIEHEGGEQHLIEAMFAKARREHRFLLLEQVDVLLSGNNSTTSNWDIMQANELLDRMGRHDLPVTATTSTEGRMDRVHMRHFTLKVTFQSMDAKTVRYAFDKILGMALPQAIIIPDGLVPADLVNLRKRFTLIDRPEPREALAMALVEVETHDEAGRGTTSQKARRI